MLPPPSIVRDGSILSKQETIDNEAYIPPIINPDQVKIGDTIERVDLLFILKNDRKVLLPILEDQYGIQFNTDPIPDRIQSISFTSRKCIISDLKGKEYFLKRKPQYSLREPQKTRAASLQISLASNLDYVPKIIGTKYGSPYANIGSSFFLLTPFVNGGFFIGRIEQSDACASALGEIHRVASQILDPQKDFIDSTQETLNFISMVKGLDFPNNDLKTSVLDEMQILTEQFHSTNDGEKGWLHGDFSPYNMVFNGNTVIAINDFDNVTYGPLARDVAECILTHTDINYAGATSSLRAPIRTTIDMSRMIKMLKTYLLTNPISKNELVDFPNQMSLLWLELMSLGLLRGDYSLTDVQKVIPHCKKINETAKQILAVI